MLELTRLPHLTLSVGGTLFAIFVVLIYRWLQPKPLKHFPHNPITSILGDIPEITRILKQGDKTLYDYYEILVDRHGPVTQLCIGNQSMLILADPAEVDRIVTRGENVEMIKFVNIIYARLMPTGQLSLPTNAMWKRHRRILGPTINQERLSRMTDNVSAAATSLVELWNGKIKAAEGNAFSAMIDLKLVMMDSIGRLALGSSLECVDSAFALTGAEQATPPIYNALRTLFTHLGHAPMLPLPSITFPLYTWLSPSWRSSRKMVREFIQKKIEETRKRESEEGGCILDILVRRERDGEETLSEDELLDEVLLLFIGGHDTTSAALFWFVKYMPSDVEIQRRLRDQLCAVFGDAPLTLDVLKDSKKVPILEAVVAETLRCAMIGGAIGRYLTRDEVILGRHVPKGTEIIVPNGLMGMDESAWGPDVKQWRPDRWLMHDGSFNSNAGPSGNPFGLGKRACFGERLAMVQLKVFIAILSRAFVFKSVPVEVGSMQAVTLVTRQPKECFVRLERWEE